LHIRWRETAPDRGLLAFALAELDVLHERAAATLDGHTRFCAHVKIELNRRGAGVSAKATGDDCYAALRRAFADLRVTMPIPPVVAAELASSAVVAA
jgi:hypothetical protein